jgi:hypothetical protein
MKYFHYQTGFIWKKEKDNEVTQHASDLRDFIHGLGVMEQETW